MQYAWGEVIELNFWKNAVIFLMFMPTKTVKVKRRSMLVLTMPYFSYEKWSSPAVMVAVTSTRPKRLLPSTPWTSPSQSITAM